MRIIDKIVADKWRVVRKIGSGSFGLVYLGVDIETGEEVAIKHERVHRRHQGLRFESMVYRRLRDVPGLPQIYFSGNFPTSEKTRILVMERLGPSLEDLFSFCGRKFTLKTVILLADQMLWRLQFVHFRHYVHRDIKPDNFLMSLRYYNKLILIDFGLAQRFRDARTRDHLILLQRKTLVGTARYASLNAHARITLSRRDDMESLGYVLMYFLRGDLPWQGLQAGNKSQRRERIYEKKASTPIDVLCRDYPPEFSSYLNYCRNLRFDERPEYDFLRYTFIKLFRSLSFSWDFIFDWTLLRQMSAEEQNSHPAVQHETDVADCDQIAKNGLIEADKAMDAAVTTNVKGTIPNQVITKPNPPLRSAFLEAQSKLLAQLRDNPLKIPSRPEATEICEADRLQIANNILIKKAKAVDSDVYAYVKGTIPNQVITKPNVPRQRIVKKSDFDLICQAFSDLLKEPCRAKQQETNAADRDQNCTNGLIEACKDLDAAVTTNVNVTIPDPNIAKQSKDSNISYPDVLT